MTSLIHRTGFRGALFSLPLLVGLLGAAGCTTPGPGTEAGLATAPAWVTRGCPGSGNRICGVGAATGMQNAALRRSAAIGRARTDIARSLQTRVAALLKDYTSSTSGANAQGPMGSEEQQIIDVSKQVTNLTLAGTEVMDTWISPNATYYALVTLEVDKFTDTVKRMQQLSDDVRSAIVDHAGDAFEELDPAP